MFVINPAYRTADFVRSFQSNYKKNSEEPFDKDGCQLIHHPFTCVNFADFIHLGQTKTDSDIASTKQLVDKAEAEARKLTFSRSINDLYTFNQSIDIVNLEQLVKDGKMDSFLIDLRNFLLSDVLPWMREITGAPLEEGKVDFTSSIYNPHDVLLCHDDELEGRRIAFIWYLVPEDWKADVDGGCLDLFSGPPEGEDDKGLAEGPWKIAASLPPHRNQLAFFEVSTKTYHQVAEIIGTRDRVSLHGWFHAPIRPSVEKVVPFRPPLMSPIFVEEDLVYRWINPFYLDMDQQAKIRRRFCRSSEIQLSNFLKTDAWEQLVRALPLISEQKWSTCGPFNRKHYDMLGGPKADAAALKGMPEVVRELYSLFTSEAILVILSDLTGINLHSDSMRGGSKVSTEPTESKRPRLDENTQEDTVAQKNGETTYGSLTTPKMRRWKVGDYTLLADADIIQDSWRLESVLHLSGYGGRGKEKLKSKCADGSVDRWQPSWGGQLIYCAEGEKDELLTVNPADNALTLVYIGPGTASFTKYINHRAKPIQSVHMEADTEKMPLKNNCETPSAFDFSVMYYEIASELQRKNGDSAEDSADEDGDADSESEEEQESSDASEISDDGDEDEGGDEST
ncbi:unnamed protein product [Calicophoron daubneyi]|uniref:Prolyl 4-hydroxylase alpha subunit domain-containing protein n=1 Tax=Calicophoron daubneyi TaxID=300641 RepID=A0AAV2TEE6_CALDB